ncbi:ABC transporter permease [Dyadobacter sp. 3J3]|uniref:ABC transporter permease n=1 Tax=Dyadobacter sp. 3J3 TaxID=2606600 RepID=UPI001E43C67E|nr:ABC transporter permease [Dyadobacter sp. 3J3]
MKSSDRNYPPRWIERLLTWFHPEETREEVLGDLEELYAYWFAERGRFYALFRYIFNVFSVMPPFVRRRKPKHDYSKPIIFHPDMIQNYFKIAFRNLQKNKLYSFINLTGLTLGLAVAITLFWIVRFEYSFDNYHAKADRIYRVSSTDKFGMEQSHVPQGVIKALNTQVPGIEMAANLQAAGSASIKVGTEIFEQKNVFYSPPQILEMLDVKWIEGSPKNSLSAVGNVVLDEETAQKLFHGDAINKTFRFDNQIDLTVSGVIKKVPSNSEFPFQMVISRETWKHMQPEFQNEEYWGGGDSMNQGFVLVKKNSSPDLVNRLLTSLAEKHKDVSIISTYRLQPLSEMHFDTDKDSYNYSMPQWLIYTLISIGLFLIFIACINFVNLATVQAIQRSREIAMRKILGSGKGQLIAQFFGETFVLVFIALLLGSLLATNLIQYSSELINTKVADSAVWEFSTLVFLLILGLVVTLLAGIYPAMVLTGFQPIKALQNKVFVSTGKGISLRSTLVVFQFVIAQVLIICTILGIKQIRYFYEKDLGFEKSEIITVPMPERGNNNLRERFRQDLSRHSEIKDVAFGLTTPASKRNHWWGSVSNPNFQGSEKSFRIQHVDTNYFSFFHISLLAGRGLTSSDTTTNTGLGNTDVVINEKAAFDMGFKDSEKVLGQRLEIWGDRATVVGVVKNYYSETLKGNLMPHVFLYRPWNFQLASIRIDPAHKAEALEHIGKDWKTLFPNNYYDPKFLEDDIKSFYDNEKKLSNFLTLFAGVGIVIGSLGLFGLVSFVVTQRTKEIGVRKVLGATVGSIVTLLSKDFLTMVSVAFVIASPLAWYVMKAFLLDYTYKIDIEIWVFAVAGILTTGVAFLTVSFQSIKAALMNPVKSLKSE